MGHGHIDSILISYFSPLNTTINTSSGSYKILSIEFYRLFTKDQLKSKQNKNACMYVLRARKGNTVEWCIWYECTVIEGTE